MTSETQTKGFLDLFYDILFHPSIAFEEALSVDDSKKNRLLLYGVLFVVVVSALSPMLRFMSGNDGGNLMNMVVQIPLQVAVGLTLWLVMTLVISLLAYAFTGDGQPRNFMMLSAFSTLPWVLMIPMTLFKQGLGTPGAFIESMLGLGLWFWTVVLFGMSIGKTYRLSLDRVLIVLVMPFTMLMVLMAWSIGFIMNLLRFL